ncbi:hypothetical protein EV356DRAFT_573394 [Viridothelium virens]|uniref:DUF1989 domain-containing protein n=1 Tax=Viridothelium virens TaxID=1048519 RepID=A0A6A6HJS2_VIRVR|nr:hypothetical protein EV356DRAFT_573394 [Viridothelium virens]
MSGNIQTIPARHGTATYVPQGHSIKIINSSGTQVIDTWAFALHAPPTGKQKKTEKSQGQARPNEGKKSEGSTLENNEKKAQKDEGTSTPASEKDTQTVNDEKDSEERGEPGDSEKSSPNPNGDTITNQSKSVQNESVEAAGDSAQGNLQTSQEDKSEAADQNPSSQKGKLDDSAGSSSKWSAYIPSWSSSPKTPQGNDKADTGKTKKAPAKLKDQKPVQQNNGGKVQPSKWSSYMPTWSSSKGEGNQSSSKGWSAYIPSGQGFSSYLPSQGQLSAFAALHARNPGKSYAEQLYDFSKTPVGAAGLSAATGSGYAGSLYAGYNAYSQSHDSVPPMECMSMPHTRAQTHHMRPKVKDVFYSNLREPLMTLVEDTSPGIHDTLIAACDPHRYKGLGVKDWEKHGSCAENLVFALQEFNQKIGLKGSRAVGADVTVNMVPAPLNLFMNIPWDDDGNVTFEAGKCKKGDYVRLRAERDVVVVMSSCPQDILDINGKKPQAGHFIVEDSEGKPSMQGTGDEVSQSTSPASPRRQFTGAEASLDRLRDQRKGSTSPAKAPAKLPPKKEDTNDIMPKRGSTQSGLPSQAPTQQPTAKPTPSRQDSEMSQQSQSRDQSATPKRKPKKLERRGTPKAAD